MSSSGWLDEFKAEKNAWWITWAIIVVFGIIAMLILASLPPVIPIFYSLPWGQERLMAKSASLIIVAGAALLFGFNTVVARKCMQIDKFLGRMLIWSSVIAVTLLLLSLVNVWLLFL